jgi:pilus assembly protein CpaB
MPMRMNNVIMLVIAFVCAALAALLSQIWLSSQSSEPAQKAAASRHVVVAARDLKPGDKLQSNMLKVVEWPGNIVPKGAFLSKEPLLQKDKLRTVAIAIAENEPLLEHKLSQSGANGLVSKLSESMNAVTIRVNDVAGVAGFVGPGDHVDVFLTYNNQSAEALPQRGGNRAGVVVLLQNVRVLAVDQVTERKATTSPPKAVTLEVNTEDAQKLILASSIGQLSLALKRDANGKEQTRAIAADDFLPSGGQRSGAVTMSNSSGSGAVVGVTRSTERREYHVQPVGPQDDDWQHQTLSR